jgi:curli production assembly/transport component CsgG
MAGVIIEGGIIDYNSNTLTGGSGVAVFGIGAQTQYTQDIVVISLRLVSVQTGEVLTTVTVEKNLLSTSDGITGLRFFNNYTDSFEIDSSQTFNEPGNYALRSAIEQGVVELIKKGERQGLWQYKQAKIEEKIDEKIISRVIPEKVPEPKAEKSVPAPADPITTAAKKTKTGTVTAWVRIRQGKTYSVEYIEKIAPGTEVNILEEQGEMTLVQYKDKKGWMQTALVSIKN